MGTLPVNHIKYISNLVEKEGVEKAREKIIQKGYTTREEINKNLEEAEKNKYTKDPFSATVENLAYGAVNNLYGVASKVSSWLDGSLNEEYSKNNFEKVMDDVNFKIMQNSNSQDNGIIRKVTELAPAIGNMVPAIALQASAPGPVGKVMSGADFALSGAGNYQLDAKNRGATNQQAELYGDVLGTAEGLTEMIQLGRFANAFGKLTKGLGKNVTKEAGKSLVKEALKDYGINIAENFVQEAVMEPIQETANQLILGESDWNNIGSRMINAGIDGALVATIMSGASAGIGSSVNVVDKIVSGNNVSKQEINQAIYDMKDNIKTDNKVINNAIKEAESEQLPTANIDNTVQNSNNVETLPMANQDYINELTNRANEILPTANQINTKYEELPSNINGAYSNNEITLNSNKLSVEKFGHELTHHLSQSKGFETFSDYILTELDKNNQLQPLKDEIYNTYSEQYAKEGRTITDEILEEEVVARYSEKLFSDEKEIDKLLAKDRNFVQKIYDWIVDKIDTYKSTKNMTEEQKAEYKMLKNAQKLYQKALRSDFKAQISMDIQSRINDETTATSNMLETAYSSNNKQKLLNELNNTSLDADTKQSLTDAINGINVINNEAYSDMMNQIKDMDNSWKDYNNNQITKTNFKYDSSIVEDATSIVPANKQGRRTKAEWLKVAEQIATNVKDKSELKDYAEKSWRELHPNIADNLNRQGEKYVKFTKDEWINVFENANDKKYSIAGVKGATNLNDNTIDNYNQALQMNKVGVKNEDIRQATGWFKDKNGDWKFEFTDKYMELKEKLKPNTSYKLGDILKHDTLFEAYPELKNYNVKIKDFGKRKAGGNFNKVTKDISLNNKILNNSELSVQGTLIHEIQHAIQDIENFEGGKSSRGSKLAYYNSLGEIEAKDTQLRFIQEKKGKNIFTAPESSKQNPKHNSLDNYLNSNRKVIDKIKDSVYNFFNNRGDSYEDIEEDYKEDIWQNNGLVDGGYRGLNDTRYSIESDNKSGSFFDNKGRKLSKEQQEYFKDSIVKDNDGNLLTVYHGTPYEFNQFKYDKLGENTSSLGAGFYFTDKIETAEEYKRGGGNVKEVYLDIKKPLKYGETTMTKSEYGKFIKAINKETNGTYFEDYGDYNSALMEYDYGGDDIDLVSAVHNVSGLSYDKTFEILRDTIGFDGIVSDEGFLNKGEKIYVTLNSNQIKNVDNVNPTTNSDIRYSLETNTDDQGRILTKEQKEYFKNSKAVAPNGNLETVYHGSNKAGFTEFNRNVNYYTNNKQVAQSYTGGTEMVDTRKLESISDAKSWLKGISDEIYIEGNNIYDYDGEKILSYQNENELLRNLKRDIQKEIGSTEAGGIYEGYVNIEKPIVIDAKNEVWSMLDVNNIKIDGISNIKQFLKDSGSSTWMEKGKLRTSVADIVASIYDAVEDGTMDADGIIIKNVFDEGGYGNISPTEKGTDYITFNSNQFKAVNNLNPTTDSDIRYALEKGQRKHYESIKNSSKVSEMGRGIAKNLLENERYIPIKNTTAMNYAETKLQNNGINDTYTEFKNKLNSNDRMSVKDIALGERLIQELSKAGDYQRASEVIQDVAMLGTELGQQVQAMSLINKITPEGQLSLIEKTINRLNQNEKNLTKDINLKTETRENILKASNQEELDNAISKATQEIAEQLPLSISDKLRSWRYLAMLGNPRTHIRNILSNVAMKATQGVKNKVAGAIEDITAPTARTKTAKRSSRATLEFASQDAVKMQSRLSDGGHEDILSKVKINKRSFDNKVLNKLAEFNSNLLEKEDWIFLKSAYKGALANYMTANNLTSEYLSSGSKTANIALENARAYAINQAQEATFRKYSELANTISRIENLNSFSKFVVGGALPFKKTPINIAKAGFEYSPIGLLKATKEFAFDIKSGKKTVNQAIDTMAKGLTGTSIVGLGMLLASMGILKGSGSDDDKEENYLESLGEQTYAVKIGNKSYTLDWLSPTAMPLFVGVELYNSMQNTGSFSLNNLASASAQTINPLMEMSMLQSFTSALSSYSSEGTAGKLSDMGLNIAESYVGQFVPTLSAQIARTIDNTERNTSYSDKQGFEKTLDKMKNRVLAKIPFASMALQPKTDIWGNEVKRDSNILLRAGQQMIAPYYSKEIQESKVDAEIKRVYAETANNKVLPTAPNSKVTINSTQYTMTPSDYTEYKKEYGNTAKKTIDEVISTKEYKSLTDEEKSSVIQKIYDDTLNKAKGSYAEDNNLDYDEAETTKKINELKKNGLSTINSYIYTGKIAGIGGTKDSTGETISGTTSGNKAKYIMNMNTTDKQKNLLLSLLTDSSNKPTVEDLKLITSKDYSTYFKLNSNENDSGVSQRSKYVNQLKLGIEDEVLKDYYNNISKITGTKDSNGKTISGSKKMAVFNYINSLNTSGINKAILYAYAGYGKDYASELFNYINSMDITVSEKRNIWNSLNID